MVPEILSAKEPLNSVYQSTNGQTITWLISTYLGTFGATSGIKLVFAMGHQLAASYGILRIFKNLLAFLEISDL